MSCDAGSVTMRTRGPAGAACASSAAVMEAAAALGKCQPLPSLPDPAGGRPEAAVEVAAGVHGADDRVQPDCLQPEPLLALPAEGSDHLVQRKDHIDVVRLPAQPLDEPGQHLAPPSAQEVVFDVGTRKARFSWHGAPLGAAARRPARSAVVPSGWTGLRLGRLRCRSAAVA